MGDLAGWKIVSDDDNGSILVQSPQGHRRRIWKDETEEENATLLAKVNEQQEEIERLRGEREAERMERIKQDNIKLVALKEIGRLQKALERR